MELLKQSTPASILVGPVLDSTGASYASAVIGDFNITKNGTSAAMAAAATATHSHNGLYVIALTTGNTDTAGQLVVSCNKATYAMQPCRQTVLVATVFDALITNATTAAGGLGDIQRMAGTALTARDIGASVLLSSGIDTGQLSITNGIAKVDVDTIKTNPVVNGGTITFPTGATLASTTGAVGSVTGAIGSIGTGGITAASFGASAITASVLASNCITSTQVANNTLTSSVFATGCLHQGAFADGALVTAKFADGFLTAIKLGADLSAGVGIVDYGTAQAAGGTSITLRAAFSANNDVLIGATVSVYSSTNGKWSNRIITDWDNTTKVATVSVWDQQPTGTILYVVKGTAPLSTGSGATAAEVRIEMDANSTVLAAILDDTGTSGVVLANDSITAAKIADNAIDAATFAADARALLGVIDYGTAQSATTTTIVLQSGFTASDDVMIGATILVKSSTNGTWCRAVITDWVSSTDTATVDSWTVTPTGTITYVVFATAIAPLSLSGDIANAVWDEPTSGHVVSGTFGEQCKTDIDAILDDTGHIGTAGAGLTALATQASVNTVDDFLDTEIAAIKAKTDLIPASPAAIGSAMTLSLTQAVPNSNTAGTVGDALNAARAQGFGKWTLVGTTLSLYGADGTTVVKTLTLDSATTPTTRT